MSDHPLVAAYLRRLATACAGAQPDRRHAFLEDVAAHLRETVPPNATDDHARRLLAEFGEPEALAAEAFGAPGGASSRRKRTHLRIGGVLLAVGAVVAMLIVNAYQPLARVGTEDARAAGTDVGATESVVTLHPSGPSRTAEGRTYVEYVRSIETLPPLPPNSQYPEGVPAGPEPTEPVMTETGAGTVIAAFTWLCAWESEYVNARDVQAYDRVLVAEQALRSWARLRS